MVGNRTRRGGAGSRKARYQQHLDEAALITILQREWDAAERSRKRHEIAEHTKTAGIFAGKLLLNLLILGGIVTVAGVAPNAFAMIGRHRRMFGSGRHFKKSLINLRYRGYTREVRTPHGRRVVLTEKGRRRALVQGVKEIAIAERGAWDGKWRVVFFDIPRRKNAERNAFRAELRRIGMEPLQASVFISRFPCREEVQLLAGLFSVGHCVYFFETEEIAMLDAAAKRA